MLLSKGLLLVYLFGSILLNFFHHHTSPEAHHQNNVKVGDFSVSTLENGVGDDCLACHFHHTANSLVPEGFTFEFRPVITIKKVAVARNFKVHFTALRRAALRGPPLV